MNARIQPVEQEQRIGERIVYPIWCCGPLSRFGAYFWGGVLILLGAAWLLHNLGWNLGFSGELFLPIIVIGLGLLYLYEANLRK